jgi:hypothetical protein
MTSFGKYFPVNPDSIIKFYFKAAGLYQLILLENNINRPMIRNKPMLPSSNEKSCS